MSSALRHWNGLASAPAYSRSLLVFFRGFRSTSGGLADIAGVDVRGSAWDAGFLAWFSVLLLVGVAVVVILPHFGTEVPQRSMIWLVVSGLAFVFILLRWLTYGSTSTRAGGCSSAWSWRWSRPARAWSPSGAPPNTTPQAGTAYGA